MQLDVFTTWSRCIQVYPCMFGTSSIRVIHFEIQTRGALLACSWFLFGRSPISRKNQHEGKGLINLVQDDCDSTALPWSTSSQPEGCGRSNCSDRSLGRVKSIQKNRNDWKGDPHISLWVLLCTSTCATKHLTHLKDIYIYIIYIMDTHLWLLCMDRRYRTGSCGYMRLFSWLQITLVCLSMYCCSWAS